MKKMLLCFVVASSFICSANTFAMQVGDPAKVEKLSPAQKSKLRQLVTVGQPKFESWVKANSLDLSWDDYQAWVATPQGQAQTVVPTPSIPVVAGQFRKQYGQCPRRPGKGQFRTGRGKILTPEERVPRMVRRAALFKGNLQDANAVIVAMQQAVSDLVNDPDIQNLPAVAPVASQVQIAPPFRRTGKPPYYGRRYGKWQRKVLTQDEMVARIRCIALSKQNAPDANAFIAAMVKAIGDLANDQKIKSLPNK